MRKWWNGLTVVIGLTVIAFALLVGSVMPHPISVKVNTVAQQTIIATQTVNDIQRTSEARQAAANNTAAVYTYDQSMLGKQRDKLIRLQKAAAAFSESNQAKKKPVTGTAMVKDFKKTYQEPDAKLTDHFYQRLLAMKPADQATVFDAVSQALDEGMAAEVSPDALKGVQAVTINGLSDLNAAQLAVAKPLINQLLIANQLVDEAQTKARKAAAAANVSPVLIMQGQVIVQAGHLVDETAMHQLEVLGLLSNRGQYRPLIALVLVLLFQAFGLLTLLHLAPPANRRKNALMYSGLMLTMLVVMLGLRYLVDNSSVNLTLLLPVTLVPLLLRTFVGRRMALLAVVMQTLFAYFAFYSTTGTILSAGTALAYLLFGSLCTMISMRRLSEELAKAAFWGIVMPLTAWLALAWLQGFDLTKIGAWQNLAYVLLSLLAGYGLAVGATPYLEMLWADDALFRLNRLSNPNDPLLKRLLEEAPGTYHHSMMVANLAANAVAAIGGRQMLTRVACYYHDVGKLSKPLYFTENQPAGYASPHQELSPQQSAAIILAHVTDGVAMLQARHMPQFVIDICAQHHGTTLVKYFYTVAKNADESVTEAAFRYAGPKPQTLEAAVVNIADTCEAAVRSMPHPTPEGIASFTHNIIDERFKDGQFDQAPITVAQLRVVERSLVDGLASTFYNRIEYPQLKETKA